MLCLAGILCGDVLFHAQLHEEVGQQPVAAVNALGDLAARFQQGQVALTVHRNVAVLPQLFHRDADAGFGVAQFVDHVDGTDAAHPLIQHQDRFKVIFCGLVDLHGCRPPAFLDFRPGAEKRTTVRFVIGYHILPGDASRSAEVC